MRARKKIAAASFRLRAFLGFGEAMSAVEKNIVALRIWEAAVISKVRNM
jgi:hypothetical protein